jgi:hypothetical protein
VPRVTWESIARTAIATAVPITAACRNERTSAASGRSSAVIADPLLAADMIDPKLAADMTEPQLAADMAEAALDAEPTDSTELTEPIEPIDKKLPTDAMLRTEPRLAIDSTESSDAIDHLDAMCLTISRLTRPPAVDFTTLRRPDAGEYWRMINKRVNHSWTQRAATWTCGGARLS